MNMIVYNIQKYIEQNSAYYVEQIKFVHHNFAKALDYYKVYTLLCTYKLRRIGVLNRPHVNWSLLLG